MSELEASYRRLLRAYPGFYRRDRGLEILTTLMDAAGEGQTRPSRGEAAHLVLTGLRYRLVPPGRIAWIAAALVTIWTALVLSGAGALAAWSYADPRATDLAALSDSLIGRAPTSAYAADGAGPLDIAYFYQAGGGLQSYDAEGWTGPDPVPMGAAWVYTQVTDVPTVIDRARRTLHGAGWQTGDLVPGGVNSQGGVFWAVRDGMLLRVSGYDQQTGMTIDAYPVAPAGVLAGAITGFVIGLLLAWPAMTWLAHRAARAPRPARRWIMLAALPGVIACGVNGFDSVMSMIPMSFSADYMYPLASQIANPLAAIVVGLSLLATLHLLTRTSPDHRPELVKLNAT